MINIIDKKKCCGCSSCAQRCPQKCIEMRADEEGFLYPHVDTDTCINCGLCEKKCPVLNPYNSHAPIECYAAKNPNKEVNYLSSSGGIFHPLQNYILEQGGIVFGARFNDKWEVVHSYIVSISQGDIFRGSKYVQSRIGTSYIDVEKFLKDGRTVLFSGTPCQIAGLKHFLGKDYSNLILVDIVCHGVPSPRIWKEYLASLSLKDIGAINHKDKKSGWNTYSIVIKNSNGDIIFSELSSKNKYLKAFKRNLILRQSCYNCSFKSGKSHSDITLADFWGIKDVLPYMDDETGVSLVCCNTNKGKDLINSINIIKNVAPFEEAVKHNECIIKSTKEPVNRTRFWQIYNFVGINVLYGVDFFIKRPLYKRILNKIKSI